MILGSGVLKMRVKENVGGPLCWYDRLLGIALVLGVYNPASVAGMLEGVFMSHHSLYFELFESSQN